MDGRATPERVFALLDHHDSGPLPHDETVAILVPWPRSQFGGVIESGGQCPCGNETGKSQAIDRRFRATRNHHVGRIITYQARGIADGMGAGGTRGSHGMVRTLEAETDRT